MTDSPIDSLLKRRSVLARDLVSPGPTKEELDQILAAAHRVPDHGKLGPWRFIIFQGESRTDFGKHLAEIFLEDNPDTTSKCLDFESDRFNRAPLVVAVISSPQEHKVPEWEQTLSCGAACQNILHAANVLGYGAQWLTEWYAYHKRVNQLLELTEKEKVAGFIYIGKKAETPKERNRPSLEERVTHWSTIT